MSDVLRIQAPINLGRPWAAEMRTELVRKSIHLLIGLVPTIAAWNFGVAVALLVSGILVYSYSELMRLHGYEIVIIGRITAMAARRRDAGKFVNGPVTLAIGALLALAFYPEPAASIGIYALAFGDGLSSLVGKAFGSIRLPFTGGKSLEGSLTCFTAVMCSTFAVSGDASRSVMIALVATITEAAPTKDMDNILLPFVVGFTATLLLRLP